MSGEYHKIQTVWDRDPENNFKTLLEGQWAKPEFGYLKNAEWVWTEKVDGTNIRVKWDGSEVRFGGRTDKAQIPTFLLDNLLALFPAEKLSEAFDCEACLYGEGYGPKIQKGGGNYRQDASFVLFDVRIGDIWLERGNVEDIAHKLGVDIVPVLDVGALPAMIERVRNGFDSTWGDFRAEGIVARPRVELLDRLGHRVITKLKCKDFAGNKG